MKSGVSFGIAGPLAIALSSSPHRPTILIGLRIGYTQTLGNVQKESFKQTRWFKSKRETLRFRQSVFFSILPWLLPLAYLTSCSKGFQIADSLLDQSSLAPATPRPGTPQTLTPPGPDGESPETKWISLKTVGHNDPNCLVLAEYDACIFYKNPFVQSVVALGTGLGQGLRKGQDLSKIQTFGVKLAGRTSQTRLESSSVIVTAGDVIPTQQKPVELPMVLGLQPKVSYKTDEQSVTALTHSYFWLQEMENQLKARTNVYFAAGKNRSLSAQGNSDNPSF
ncbi:MAG: hypothetical protein IPK04_17895 [Bdellovibrionales bacterium]|nr:hypothetical protein [Bdellovibrionales bacterium]